MEVPAPFLLGYVASEAFCLGISALSSLLLVIEVQAGVVYAGPCTLGQSTFRGLCWVSVCCTQGIGLGQLIVSWPGV